MFSYYRAGLARILNLTGGEVESNKCEVGAPFEKTSGSGWVRGVDMVRVEDAGKTSHIRDEDPLGII